MRALRFVRSFPILRARSRWIALVAGLGMITYLPSSAEFAPADPHMDRKEPHLAKKEHCHIYRSISRLGQLGAKFRPPCSRVAKRQTIWFEERWTPIAGPGAGAAEIGGDDRSELQEPAAQVLVGLSRPRSASISSTSR